MANAGVESKQFFLILFQISSRPVFQAWEKVHFHIHELLVVNFAETRDGLDLLGAWRHLVSPNHPSFQQNYHLQNEWGKILFPHWSKKFSALFWVLSTSLSCAESSPSIRKGNSCSIWLWKSKFHVQKIIPCPCSPLFWISVFLWKFLNSVGPHGPTSFRNFHKNTSNQKRGELVQGKLFCTVTFLFHTSNWAGKVYFCGREVQKSIVYTAPNWFFTAWNLIITASVYSSITTVREIWCLELTGECTLL